MKVCDSCGKRIDEYGHNYIKIQSIQNCTSQGYPDEYVRQSFDCCPSCTMGMLKRILIGNPQTGEISPNQEECFQKYIESDHDL